METMKRCFEDKMVVDDRAPVYTFTTGGGTSKWAVLAPNFALWQQLAILLHVQIAFQCICAVINYVLIVKQRHKNNNNAVGYVIGWGIMVPIAVLFPFWLLEWCELRNLVLKMATGTSAYVVGFRTIEAMYGTSPHSVETSMLHYCTYYSSLLHFDWDRKTHTRKKLSVVTELLVGAVPMLVLLSLFLSLLVSFEMHYDYKPFANSPVQNLHHYHFNTDLLAPAHLGNTYCLLVTLYTLLNFGLRFTALGDQIKGFRTQPIFNNPLLASRSIQEFWGKRWNLTIGTILRYGAFLPAQKILGGSNSNGSNGKRSTTVAVIYTFIVSGLIHDYAWALMFYHYDNDDHNNSHRFSHIKWKVTAFFAWNGIFMLLEPPFQKFCTRMKMDSFTKCVPSVIVSTLLTLTSLPVTHWYIGDWVKGGYFEDISIGLWQVRKLS